MFSCSLKGPAADQLGPKLPQDIVSCTLESGLSYEGESDSGESFKSDATLELENSFVPLPRKSVLVTLESILIKPANCGSMLLKSQQKGGIFTQEMESQTSMDSSIESQVDEDSSTMDSSTMDSNKESQINGDSSAIYSTSKDRLVVKSCYENTDVGLESVSKGKAPGDVVARIDETRDRLEEGECNMKHTQHQILGHFSPKIPSKSRFTKKSTNYVRLHRSRHRCQSSSSNNSSLKQNKRSKKYCSSRSFEQRKLLRYRSRSISYYKLRTVKSYFRKNKFDVWKDSYGDHHKTNNISKKRTLLVLRPEHFKKSSVKSSCDEESNTAEQETLKIAGATPEQISSLSCVHNTDKPERMLAEESSLTEMSNSPKKHSYELNLESEGESTEISSKDSEITSSSMSNITMKKILNTPIKNFSNLRSSLQNKIKTDFPINFDGYMNYGGTHIGIPGISKDYLPRHHDDLSALQWRVICIFSI